MLGTFLGLGAGLLGELGEQIPELRAAQARGTLPTEGIEIIERFFSGSALAKAETDFGRADIAAKALGESLANIGVEIVRIRTAFSTELRTVIDDFNSFLDSDNGQAIVEVFRQLSQFTRELVIGIGAFVGLIVTAKIATIFGPAVILITKLAIGITLATRLIDELFVQSGAVNSVFGDMEITFDGLVQAIRRGTVGVEDFARIGSDAFRVLTGSVDILIALLSSTFQLPVRLFQDLVGLGEFIGLQFRRFVLEVTREVNNSLSRLNTIPFVRSINTLRTVLNGRAPTSDLNRQIAEIDERIEGLSSKTQQLGVNLLQDVGGGLLQIQAGIDGIGKSLDDIERRTSSQALLEFDVEDAQRRALQFIQQLEGALPVEGAGNLVNNALAERQLNDRIQQFDALGTGPLITEADILDPNAVQIVTDKLASIPQDKQIQDAVRDLASKQLEAVRQADGIALDQFLELNATISTGAASRALEIAQRDLEGARSALSVALDQTEAEAQRLDGLIEAGRASAFTLAFNAEGLVDPEQIKFLVDSLGEAEVALLERLNLNSRKARENFVAAREAIEAQQQVFRQVQAERLEFETRAIEGDIDRISSVVQEAIRGTSGILENVNPFSDRQVTQSLDEIIAKFREARAEADGIAAGVRVELDDATFNREILSALDSTSSFRDLTGSFLSGLSEGLPDFLAGIEGVSPDAVSGVSRAVAALSSDFEEANDQVDEFKDRLEGQTLGRTAVDELGDRLEQLIQDADDSLERGLEAAIVDPLRKTASSVGSELREIRRDFDAGIVTQGAVTRAEGQVDRFNSRINEVIENVQRVASLGEIPQPVADNITDQLARQRINPNDDTADIGTFLLGSWVASGASRKM